MLAARLYTGGIHPAMLESARERRAQAWLFPVLRHGQGQQMKQRVVGGGNGSSQARLPGAPLFDCCRKLCLIE
jgi:hypothetical protein